ncbi:MAG: hypothetical protein JW750_12410 [Anaerolineaceae bacterium]|nr:hypothetical protein [Anaerolineaceae bacterium]
MARMREKVFWYKLLAILLVFSMGCTMLQGFLPFSRANNGSADVSANPQLSESGGIMEASYQMAEGGEDGDGFVIHLSDGTAADEEVAPIEPVKGEPLTQEAIDVILARLPEMEMAEDDQVEFKLPPDVLPPPRTGETIEQSFPPEEETVTPDEVTSGALEVLRYSPEGEISVAPFIAITFNQPMVPLATLQQLKEEDVPVEVTPDLPGNWRWVGTKTLAFYYDSDLIDRLPKATEYTVVIPAGTESAVGGKLDKEVRWTFSTPAPVLVSSYPYSSDPQDLEPLFFAAFDQRVDPEAVLPWINATADDRVFDVRLASDEEIEAEESLKYLLEETPEGRWIAFKAEKPLPKDSDIVVEFKAGMPSAEGPLTTQAGQSYSFRTYAPLKIVEHGCSWGGDECYPMQPFFIRFNNPLDADAYEEEMITIDPPIPGAMVNVVGDTITISGMTASSTNYRVTVDETIQDVFGQTLGRDEKLTFKVGKAEPVLIGPNTTLVTVDPYSTQPGLSVYSITYPNLEVAIYAVEPTDWPAFKKYLQDYAYTDQVGTPPGKKVFDDRVEIGGEKEQLAETLIDLSSLMDGDFGHFIVIVKPPKGFFEKERYWETIHAWVQVTQLGVDTFVDHSEMVVWTSALKDGAPLADVNLLSNGKTLLGKSGKDGTIRFDLPSSGIQYLVASQADDKAILPTTPYEWDESTWEPREVYDNLVWHVFDDRAMYKPGETVHLKGWLRVVGGQEDGDVELPDRRVNLVLYSVIDPQGNEIAAGEANVDELGGFDLDFNIPDRVNLGYASVTLSASGNLSGINGNGYYHGFQIQEFRRPEFEVQARNETTGPYFVGDEAVTAVEANYYAGGALPNAEVNWNVSSEETNYQPPNWPDFAFGEWRPWWWYDWYWQDGGGQTYQSFAGRTDASGTHYLEMEFVGGGSPRPRSVVAEAVVMDVNRQAWASTTTLMVHPASVYVGMRTERYFVERGTPLDVDLIAVDLDGKPVTGSTVSVTAERMTWKYVDGQWQEIAADTQTCTLSTEGEIQTCSFETELGGKYQITAIVADDQGRENRSRITRWVSGGEVAPSRNIEQETVTLIPNQETYQPGDSAEILVQSPFGPAEGLLTVSRSGILYTERFSMEEDSITLEIPIKEEHIPNLVVQVDLNGTAQRMDDEGNLLEDAPARPAFATGQLTLNVPPLSRQMKVMIDLEESALAPGAETTIDVELLDADDEPVEGASLAVVVVDEAILALTNYQLADPINTFYYTRYADMISTYGRSSIILANPEIMASAARDGMLANQGGFGGGAVAEEAVEEEAMAAPMMEMDMEKTTAGVDDAAPEIVVRSNFDPLAHFAPDVVTDQNGKATVEVKLPDNLTRYRIMVVAVDESGKRFGSAESNLTARLPLMVRPAAPRFLNFGDRFDLPIVLQNQTDEDMTVDVVVNALNVDLTDGQGVRVEVPANDRVEVRFPAETELAGNAHLMIAAVSDEMSDAAKVSLPVYTPATSEAFAVYGVVDEGAMAQPLARPENVFAEYGGLEITTSSTALQSLTDAVLYLTSYPFECSEQLASRILGIAALKDVLAAFDAEGLPSPEEMQSAVVRDIERLHALQNYDGGFPAWRHGSESLPFHTVHAAHAMQRAQEMGFDIPEAMWEDALTYLTYIEDYYPYWYSEQARWTISAYALYVRDRMGDPDPAKAMALLDEAGVENISLDGLSFIWQVLVNADGYGVQLEEIRQHVNNRAVETAGAANFTTDYSDSDYVLLHSNRRTDALLLDALINDDPESDLIPKVVNGLLAHRTRGRWGNTQENVFVLLALHRYFATYEAQTPDFVARVWLGETYAGENEFVGYSTDYQQISIPMDYLQESMAEDDLQDLIIEKDGDGRLYYRLGLRYAPTDLRLPPEEMGFVVQRVYEAVDDPDDVKLMDDGTWQIKLGARVRVRVTMVADNRRYHVALVDPLPAGLEIINPALVVSESVPADPAEASKGWWWWWQWYEHQNLRDERAEAFTSLLWEGTYEYTYVARATTPGKFVVPPAKAEEMYSPEVFGRSAGDLVLVE